MKNQLLKQILTQTLEDVLSSVYKTGINFRLYDSTDFVGYFIGYSLVEMCEHSGCPKLTPRFLCFDTEGRRTQCDPYFDNIKDFNDYHNAMRELEFWQQQIDIKQTLDAITELHHPKIQHRS